MSNFRKNIDEMEGYRPGEQPEGPGFIKLNTNESPYPVPPAVIEAITKEAANLRLYPPPLADALVEKAAAVYGVKRSQILASNGSDELLTIIVRSFVSEGEMIFYPEPTYILYETLAKIQNAKSVSCKFSRNFDLPDEIFGNPGKITFVANPNSPSGTMTPKEVIKNLANSLKGILVIDEAYVDFADFNCLDLVGKIENIVVLRTFSKSFSMAGARLGLAFADDKIIAGMIKVKDSYNVGRLPIAAGISALENIDYFRQNIEKIKAARARLSKALEKMKFEVLPSQANFVMVRRKNAEEIYRKLREKKILTRYFAREDLADSLRITVGSEEEIGALLRTLKEIL